MKIQINKGNCEELLCIVVSIVGIGEKSSKKIGTSRDFKTFT